MPRGGGVVPRCTRATGTAPVWSAAPGAAYSVPMAEDKQEQRRLDELFARIGTRTQGLAQQRGSWPCHAGCDACCRRLGRPPELSRAEWQRLWRSFVQLDDDVRARVRVRVSELERAEAEGASHFTCPFLERESGRCQVYEDRPAACRMFGFYVSRAEGRYCDEMRERVDQGEFEGVVWGNQQAVERELARDFGELIAIVAWFAQAPEE